MALGHFISFWLRVFSGIGGLRSSSMFLDCEGDLSAAFLALEFSAMISFLIHR